MKDEPVSKSKFEQDRDEAAIHDVCRRVNGSTEWAKIWSYGADWAREYTLKEADALIGEMEVIISDLKARADKLAEALELEISLESHDSEYCFKKPDIDCNKCRMERALTEYRESE